jgi:hypothetical protein
MYSLVQWPQTRKCPASKSIIVIVVVIIIIINRRLHKYVIYKKI